MHPAYHALPNGGHGSFAESANLRFNCVLVFATGVSGGQSNALRSFVSRIYIHSAGYVIPISTAPAVDPAIIERKALGRSFFFSGSLACCTVAIVKTSCGEQNIICKVVGRNSFTV